ncbi:MAG: glycosyltransferase family 4 protein [Desulfobacterales bacterium]|nr:glycosyltransferase family 4 protein [Desulfobacterales bacterium]
MRRLLGHIIAEAASAKIKLKARRAADGKFDRPRVSYGFDHVPGPGEQAHGGIVKFQGMQGLYANSPKSYNLLYLLSSYKSPYAGQIAEASKKKGAKLVWNQNGVAFPAWHGPGWEDTNAPMRTLLHLADYVFYQSKFCKESADRFLGIRKGSSEILYNAVDTGFFKPAEMASEPREWALLLSGSHWQLYRVQAALETLHAILKKAVNARLIIAGRFCWHADSKKAEDEVKGICLKLGIMDSVIFRGPYTQAEAGHMIRKAHILLHTKYNDPCPSVVLEAMACGLPVVYSGSGGVPELVGPDAGIGIPAPADWDRLHPPDPDEMAEAVLQVMSSYKVYSEAARQRAVENFDVTPWLRRHKELFESFMSGAS